MNVIFQIIQIKLCCFVACPSTTAADVVLPGVIDAMECDGTFYRLDNVPVYFEPFTDSPFPETKSNEDTLKQLFAKVKAKKEACFNPKIIAFLQ